MNKLKVTSEFIKATPEYVEDSNGNRNYISYFGSLEAAWEALHTLENCVNCVNCQRCSNCFNCTGCWNCIDSENCSNSRNLVKCSLCFGCSWCFKSSNLRCCVQCVDCKWLSGCLSCSGCSWVINRLDLTGLSGNPLLVPKIENIHQRTLEFTLDLRKKGELKGNVWSKVINSLVGDSINTLEEFFSFGATEMLALAILRESGVPKFLMVNFCLPVDYMLTEMTKNAKREKELGMKSELFLPISPKETLRQP